MSLNAKPIDANGRGNGVVDYCSSVPTVVGLCLLVALRLCVVLQEKW